MSLLPTAHLQSIDRLMREKPGFYRDVPENRSHYRKHRRKNHQMPKGKKHRMNTDAIRLLKQLEAENRLAAPDEQTVLSKYVGWGSLSAAFDETNPQWEDEYAELKSLLTPEEYAAARASTLNAHYTSPS